MFAFDSSWKTPTKAGFSCGISGFRELTGRCWSTVADFISIGNSASDLEKAHTLSNVFASGQITRFHTAVAAEWTILRLPWLPFRHFALARKPLQCSGDAGPMLPPPPPTVVAPLIVWLWKHNSPRIAMQWDLAKVPEAISHKIISYYLIYLINGPRRHN